MSDPERTCPSARAQEGAILLGVVGPDGRVGYISPAVRIDDRFVETARRQGSPEQRFRFAGTCVECRCKQWDNGRCGVIDTVLEAKAAAVDPPEPESLPRCGIRPSCRWFHQTGPAACAVCPFVITDSDAAARQPVP